MRSIAQASATMQVAVLASPSTSAMNRFSKPSQRGHHSAKRAIASAANNTIGPCAKLNTPKP